MSDHEPAIRKALRSLNREKGELADRIKELERKVEGLKATNADLGEYAKRLVDRGLELECESARLRDALTYIAQNTQFDAYYLRCAARDALSRPSYKVGPDPKGER